MKVIFTQKVSGVASPGDVKNVKKGFFRNYLLPNHKAVPATEPLVREWDERRKRIKIAQEELRGRLEEIKRRLTGAKLSIEKKITSKGTLYGGVKAADISKAVLQQFQMEIPESAVQFENPIKAAGDYSVRLNLGEGVEASLPITVAGKK